MKTIKLIITKRYALSLESNGDEYTITYEKSHDMPKTSETINDYNMASHLFDLKYQELEGN